MNGTLRRGTVALAVAAGLLLASACGDDGGDGGGGGDITWWHIQPANSPVSAMWDQFASEFNTENPDGPQAATTFYENDAFKANLATAMQGGDPPDLFQSWGGGGLAQQVEAGQVRDLTDEIPEVIEQISPGALEPYTIDGRVYGLPWSLGMIGIWYNTELFDEAGIAEEPATWSELLDAVQQLKDNDITPIALGGADKWPGHYWWTYPAMRLAGADAFAQAHESQSFDNPAFVQAGQMVEELVALDPFQEGFLAAGYEQADGQAQLMGNGGAAMELMGHWAGQAQVDNAGLEGEDADAQHARLGWFPFPAVEGGAGDPSEALGGGDGIAVGANAPDEVFDLLRHIFDSYQALVDADAGIMPTVQSAIETITDPNRSEILQTLGAAAGFQLYLDQDFPPAVGLQVNDSTAALIAGESSPEEVVSSVNEVFANEG
jgi:raffinose/stachyose/melibiose transport system substrate-binding protein